MHRGRNYPQWSLKEMSPDSSPSAAAPMRVWGDFIFSLITGVDIGFQGYSRQTGIYQWSLPFTWEFQLYNFPWNFQATLTQSKNPGPGYNLICTMFLGDGSVVEVQWFSLTDGTAWLPINWEYRVLSTHWGSYFTGISQRPIVRPMTYYENPIGP
jgi:hypothetical protein